MAGRRIKPLQLHLSDGKSRLTIEEKEQRAAIEAGMRFGTHDFKVPHEVKSDKIALKKWNEIIDLYTSGEIEFVTTADTGILMQYCLTYSEYIYMVNARKEILNKGMDVIKTYHALDELNIEHNINKKNDLLAKLGKTLYLDPQSRINTISENNKEKKAAEESEKEMFG